MLQDGLEQRTDGMSRYLIRRFPITTSDYISALPQGQLLSASVVHPPAQDGMVSVVGLDLDDQQAQQIERMPGVLALLNVSRLKLGLAEQEPQLPNANIDADEWMRKLPDVRDPGDLGAPEDIPRAFTTQTNQTVRTCRYWKPGPTLDQDGEYSSVAYSLVHHLNALPRRNYFDGEYAARLHNLIVKVEEEHFGAVPAGGPSLVAGMLALRRLGHVDEYRLALALDTLHKWLLYRGGVSIGMDCYEGMLMPDAQGFVRPTGERLGRIAVFCRGVSPWGALRLQYSYGSSVGHLGMAWLSRHDADWLIKHDTNFRAVCWREPKSRHA